MKRILLTAALVILAASTAKAGEPVFRPVEVVVDTGGRALAAYQLELSYDARAAGIVGLEGGDAPFDEAPYYDPKGLKTGRIVIAAFATAGNPPSGRVRVARIHLMETGDAEAGLSARLVVAAAPGGETIDAEIELLDMKGDLR